MLRLMLMLFVLLRYVHGAQAQDSLDIGAYAPRSIVGHFVAGPVTSVQSEICPTLFKRDEAKIAIFTRDLNTKQCDLAAAMNELVKNEPRLKWSFWMVSHENDPTPDDVTWEKTLAGLTAFAKDREVAALSTGVLIRLLDKTKPSRARRAVGVFDDRHDSVIMLIIPDEKKHYGKIRFIRKFNSTELTADSIASCQADLKAAWTEVSATNRPE